MIHRTHRDGRAESSALYSGCEAYRYALTRIWAPGPRLCFVMLNPSTADERRNDPTVERCERRARALGFGGFRVVNLFAFRATDPRDLKRAASPIGPENDRILIEAAQWADDVLCAWGVHGAHLARGAQATPLLRGHGGRLWHLGLTREGHPRHPLYVRYDQPLLPWS